ncbi:hypothetical protein ACHAWF_010666 [Thalassiosira exigua]
MLWVRILCHYFFWLASDPDDDDKTMPRRRPDHRNHANRVALSFYDGVLRRDPALRCRCSDRHVLDDVIDRWKEGERAAAGRPVKGVSRSDVIFSLKTKWKLIDSKVAEENVVIWREDVDGSRDDVNNDNDDGEAWVGVGGGSAQPPPQPHDRASRISRTVERIRNARSEMESNREGVSADRIKLGEGGICRVGHRALQEVWIRNDSDVDLYCTVKGDAARQRGISVGGEPEFELPAGASEAIDVGHLPRHNGIARSVVVFNFDPVDLDEEDSVEAFSIVRYVSIRAGDPDDYDIVKPTAPYVKRRPRRDDREKFSNPVRVRSSGARSKFVNPLGKYPIPKDIGRLVGDGNSDEAMGSIDKLFRGEGIVFVEEEKVDYSSHLTPDNYASCMQHLLWIEEVQMAVDIKTYDLIDAPLLREGRTRYKLLVRGLAENRPSVLKGDKILIHVRDQSSKFEGVVHQTTQEYAIMDLPRSFDQTYINGLRVDVRFTFSRTGLRACHQAVTTMNARDGRSPLPRIAFPRPLGVEGNAPLSPLNPCIEETSQLNFYNRTLNQEQQTAVVGVVRSVARPTPYIINGPPGKCHRISFSLLSSILTNVCINFQGTGKTVTVVESILQTIHATGANSDAKILVCAPSNTAVDVVVERLLPHMTSREMLRLVAFSRDKASVPTQIMEYTNYNEELDCFTTPSPATIKQYKLVAVTISSGGKLPNNGIADHFTHVFIDEAGHAIEPEAIGCLASVTTQSPGNPPAVVLAGDPKQLGPIIRNDICKKFGLEKSLLERLSQMEPYARSEEVDALGNHYDKRTTTKLVRNYRSHPTILDLPNKAFYDGDLIAAADITRSHRFVDWEHLGTRGFPIIFHGIEGEDMREANSPSWFNPDEAQTVKMYVDLLVRDTRRNKCKPEDIGIIAPYHKQVQKIRTLLSAHGYSDCKVGSVEEFQGSERPVIIISTVRSTVDYISFDEKHKLGFLSNQKRFNVAITRAQSLLIMVGNPFTLENDPNWKSMIDHAVAGGGYTGVDYEKDDVRQSSRSAFEDTIVGFHNINLNETKGDDDDFVVISHVTAQEGPAWRSEE